jgi:hypothetical protein
MEDQQRDQQDKPALRLKKDPKNANKGTSRGKWAVNESIRSHGAGRSILADKNGVVIAGNKTLDAAQDAGLPIKEIHTTGEELVVVVRDDLDLTKDQKARELAYADNRTAELGLHWDNDQLKEDLAAGVELDKFWNEMELKDLLEGEEENTPEQATEDGPPQMELQPLEGYDYVLVLARNSLDFKVMCEALDIGPVTFPPRGLKKQRTIGLGRCIDAKRLLRKLGKL